MARLTEHWLPQTRKRKRGVEGVEGVEDNCQESGQRDRAWTVRTENSGFESILSVDGKVTQDEGRIWSEAENREPHAKIFENPWNKMYPLCS